MMRYYSCDSCGRTLEGGDEPRFQVRVEGYAVVDDDTALEETDADSVDAMDELLTEQVAFEALEEEGIENEPGSMHRDYDLCRGCYSRMMTDPLGRDNRLAPRFSRN